MQQIQIWLISIGVWRMVTFFLSCYVRMDDKHTHTHTHAITKKKKQKLYVKMTEQKQSLAMDVDLKQSTIIYISFKFNIDELPTVLVCLNGWMWNMYRLGSGISGLRCVELREQSKKKKEEKKEEKK